MYMDVLPACMCVCAICMPHAHEACEWLLISCYWSYW